LIAGMRIALCRFVDEHLRIGKAVANIDIGQQIAGIGGVILNLLAQLANEGAQVLDLFAAIGAPHGGEKPGVSNHAAGAAHQAVENIKLLAREVNWLAAPCDNALHRFQA